MLNRCKTAIVVMLFFAAILQAQVPQRGGAPATSAIPRMPGGKPNLTGLWQALGTAYWDIQDHSAQPGAFYQLGAIGAMPAGQGIVEGGDIPYLPAAAAQQKQNFQNRL